MNTELLISGADGKSAFMPLVEKIEWVTEVSGSPGKLICSVLWDKSLEISEGVPVRVKIDGKNVYANVMEYDTIPWEDASYEAHKNYTDIQYIIEGAEVMTYAPVDQLTASGPYNEEKDVVKFDNSVAGLRAVVHGGEYMIFNPWDGHKPKACDGAPSHVKKIVVKIKEN